MSEETRGDHKAPKMVIEQGPDEAVSDRAVASEAAHRAEKQKREKGEKNAAAGEKGAASDKKIPGTFRVVRSVLDDTDEHFEHYAGSHKNTVLGAFLGLIVGLLILIIGLWNTLVIVFCVLVGAIIGQSMDGDNGIVNFFRRRFGGR